MFRLNGHYFLDVLRPEAPGLLTAVVRVPLFGELPTTPIQILQLWTREDRPALATVANYELMLGELLADSPPPLLLDALADPHPRRRSAPRLVRLGYRLIVTTDVRTDHALLHFRMAVGDGDEQVRPSGLPLILLAGQAGQAGQAGTPRGKSLTGYGWVAGY
ncbi:MAG TPA: hypothetical protein VMP67_03855 [Candidatus Limnocylindria bacterium]|nr:hypothetical protein [Candidatus Limnocylindria bacterium]